MPEPAEILATVDPIEPREFVPFVELRGSMLCVGCEVFYPGTSPDCPKCHSTVRFPAERWLDRNPKEVQMVVAAEKQNVAPREPRKLAESIEITVEVGAEIDAVAKKLGIPYRSVRDVVAAHGEDVLRRKLVGQVAAIYAGHVAGILPMQTGPAAPEPAQSIRSLDPVEVPRAAGAGAVIP